MDEEVAALMLTNPNTLGVFESDICQIADIVHSKGGFLYMDGANLNALAGITRPGDLKADVMHLNLHKTFPLLMVGEDLALGRWLLKRFSSHFYPCR